MLANGGTLAASGVVAGTAPTTTMFGNGGTTTAADLAALFGAGTSNGLIDSAALSPVAAAASAFNPLASMTDAATLLQLSQLFAAQQQHSLVQQFHVAQQQHNAQQPQHHQQQILQDKKRSYPCTFQFCVLCQKNVHSSKLPCHIRQCHVAKPMFQCPACDFTSTYSKNNVKSHMVSLHGLAGDPISYMEQYASQVEEFMKKCFPHVRGRGRPIHGGGRISPASPASPRSIESAASRRASGSFGSANGANMVSQRQYTHSQRRLSAKQAIQISLQEQLLALAKATRSNNATNENNSSSTTSPSLAHSEENGARNVPSATADVKPGVAIKLEYAESNNNTDMDTCVSSSASVTEEANRSISTTNSVTPNSGANFGIRSPLNGLKTQQIIANSQRLQPGENLQPRYLLHELQWQVLNDEQISRTVFETFNTQAFMEKLDLSHFEPLLEDSTFLTDEQLEKIADVRRQIHLQTFEIMFAVHRLDLAVLSADNVDLVASIAPSAVDIHRFKNYEMSNSVSTLGENEQFILQLSKIERMEEKLHAMSHMSRFASRVGELNQQLNGLTAAAKLLHNSAEFHNILQLLLTCGNLISGDFNAQIIKGFRTSCLLEMCSFKFPPPSESTLISILAECILKHFPELEKFMEHIPIIEKAAQTNFRSMCSIIRQLELGHSRVIIELQFGGTTPMVSDFIESAEPLLVEIKDMLVLTKEQLISTLQFFGEPINCDEESPFQPEKFFAKIAMFCRHLQKALIDLHE